MKLHRRNVLLLLTVFGMSFMIMQIFSTKQHISNTKPKKRHDVIRPSPPPCHLSRMHLRRLQKRFNSTSLFQSLHHYASTLPNSQNQTTLFKYVSGSLDREWKRNTTNARLFKSVFGDQHSDLCVCDRLMLTRGNTPPGLMVPLVHRKKESTKVTMKDIRKLSEDHSIPPPPYKSCSVIGSSGLLLGSKCGRAIDASDFVFRFNMAPTRKFKKDVGVKTNLTTMNPSVYIKLYGNLNGSQYIIPFRKLLREQRGFVWTPAYGFVVNALGMLKKIKNIAKPINKNLEFITGDPMHFKAVHKFWKNHGLPNMTTTGFYFMTTAVAMCQKVDVYGFWPFNMSIDGRPLMNHYYNDLDFPPKGHDMSMEFKLILAMHHHGLLRLHLNQCQYPVNDNYSEEDMYSNADIKGTTNAPDR